MAFRFFHILILSLLATAPLGGEEILSSPANLGFEEGTPGVSPAFWETPPAGEGVILHAETVDEGCLEGLQCARLSRRGTTDGYGALVQVVRADAYRGKRLRLRGVLRAKGQGRALLYLQLNLPGDRRKSLVGVDAGADWRLDEIVAEVPADAGSLQFGIVQTGPLEVWLDAVTLEILGDAGVGNEGPRPLEERGVANLKALARLVGLVRYFHPSDQAARLDWPAWALQAVDEVEKARSDTELVAVISRLLQPVAPTARVFRTGDPPPPFQPVRAPGARPIAWRHYGLGTGTPRSQGSFSSRRIGGFERPSGSGGLTWVQDAAPLRGRSFRLTAAARIEPGGAPPEQAALWLRVSDAAGRPLAEERRPIEARAWRDLSISFTVPEEARTILLGAFLAGGGELFLDDVQVVDTESLGRRPLADGFETGMSGQIPQGWLVPADTRAAGYRIEVSETQPRSGHRCARIAWEIDVDLPDPAVPLRADLGGGASLLLPLALFTSQGGTLPHKADAAIESRKPVGFLPSGRDRTTRLADVILLWAALDHFYPYFDRLDVDWSASLDRTLRVAAQDPDERSFLDTLRRLAADLRDNHATVTHESDRADHRLPLLWDRIESRLVVTWVDPLVKEVQPGDVVEQIEGRPADEAIAAIEPLVSGATPAYRLYRSLELLSAGPQGSPRNLVLRRGDSEFSVTLRTTAPFLGPDRLRGNRPAKVAEIRPGLFYLDLDRIDDKDFEAALPRLVQARGLIFDLRGYPEKISEVVIAHLLSQASPTPGTWTPIRTRPDQPPKLDYLAWTIRAAPPRLSARTVFLTDARAFSRAETYLEIVREKRLAEIVGAATGGTNGEVNSMDLPGGYSITWTGNRTQKLDGSPLQGVGIQPTLPVKPGFEAVVEGRDAVLEKAIDLFQ